MTSPPVLVLGIGNILLQDEGIGVRVVEALERRYRLPAEVEALDGGTAGMELMEPMANREHVIIVDAVQSGDPPGTIVQLRDEEVPALFRTRISPHEIGLADVLATMRLTGESPDRLSLIGIVPESLELSLELTETVAGRLDELVALVVSLLAELGHRLVPAQEPAP